MEPSPLSPQAVAVEINRNIYGQKAFIAEDFPTVLAIGERLVNALRLRPALADQIPGGFNPAQERLSVDYRDPELYVPGSYYSAANLLNISTSASKDTSEQVLWVDGTLLDGAAEAVEQVAEAPMQALPRLLVIKFAKPEQTIAAAYQLGAAGIDAALEEKARHD